MKRKFQNLNSVNNILTKAGFIVKIIDFSAVPSFGDQVVAVAEADVMVGVHGAGLTHLLHLPPFSAVIEIGEKKWEHFRNLCVTSDRIYYRVPWVNGGKEKEFVNVDTGVLANAAESFRQILKERNS